MKYISGHEFYLKTIGKKIDVDGAYGNQCVDLWNYYNKLVNDGTYINCQPSGYAYSLFENRANNGVLKYFDVVDLKNIQDGDWVIWGKGSKPCPSSHVAMFRKDNGNGTGIFLGQNQDGKLSAVDQRSISYSGIIGVLRSKAAPTIVTQQYLNLEPTSANRTVYNLSITKKVGMIKPSKYGGLSYIVHRYINNRYIEISTGYGHVAICIDPKVATGFSITSTRKFKNGD